MTWRDLILLCAAVGGFILPLLWAIRELYLPRDDEPLRIDPSYSKDDRFFAHTLERLLAEQLGANPRIPGLRAVGVDGARAWVVTTRGDFRHSGAGIDRILDVQGNLRVTEGSVITRAVYAAGDAEIGPSSRLSSLTAKRSATLARDVAIESWIDSEEALRADEGCHLGSRATAGGSVHMGAGVTFGLVSAQEIEVERRDRARRPEPIGPTAEDTGVPLASVIPSDVPLSHLADQTTVVGGSLICPEGAQVKGNVIVRGSAVLGEEMVLNGSLYADGAVLMRRGARVTGSLLAGGAVRIDEHSQIGEHLISGDVLRIGENTIIGSPERTTTVLGYDRIELGPGVRVYGRILAYRGGKTI